MSPPAGNLHRWPLELPLVAALAGVLAGTADTAVLPLRRDQLVLTRPTADPVVAGLGLDLVVAAVADDHVGVLRALELVGGVRPDDGRAAAGACIDVLPVSGGLAHRRGLSQIGLPTAIRVHRPDIPLRAVGPREGDLPAVR